MKNLLTLCNDSSFAVQFSVSVSKTRAILLFTRKIIKMFELTLHNDSSFAVQYSISVSKTRAICCL